MTALTATAVRERKHRKSIKRHKSEARRPGFNVHSDTDRAMLKADCAFKAVQTVFSHLAIDDLRKPPRQYKDAQLARQIATAIMVRELEMEQRQVCRMQGRQRTSIHFALQTVDLRLEDDVFAAAYAQMAARAVASYAARMAQAEEA